MNRLLFSLALICFSESLARGQSNAPPATTNPSPGTLHAQPSANTPPTTPPGPSKTGWAKLTDNIEWAKWAGNVLTTLNLALVIYLFVQTQNVRKDERKEDVARSVVLFWVQDLILKPNLDALHKFFNKYEQEMERLMKVGATGSGKALQAKAVEGIAEFKSEFHDIRRKVLEPLIMVSPTFAGVRDVFSSIEDLVCDEYGRIPGVAQSDGAGSNAAEDFRRLRAQFFGNLHRSQVQLVAPSVADGGRAA